MPKKRQGGKLTNWQKVSSVGIISETLEPIKSSQFEKILNHMKPREDKV